MVWLRFVFMRAYFSGRQVKTRLVLQNAPLPAFDLPGLTLEHVPVDSDSAKLDTSAPNDGAAPTVSITTDTNNDMLVNIAELGSASSLVSRVSFNANAAAGDQVQVTATNGASALSSQTLTLTAADIAAGYKDVSFDKPASK